MAKRKTSKKSASVIVRDPSVPKADKVAVQAALQATFWLQGNLKSTRMAYLRVAGKLAEVRDQKHYLALGHADIESYAQQRLHLGRTSLGNYLRIHDWAKQRHPEWLVKSPKGFIPDLSDIGDLMWIEDELMRKDLSTARRAALERLQEKGLAGDLRQAEVRKWRKQDNSPENSLKKMISSFRLLRKRAAALKNMPPEAVRYLDEAIEVLVHDKVLQTARLSPVRLESPKSSRNYFA